MMAPSYPGLFICRHCCRPKNVWCLSSLVKLNYRTTSMPYHGSQCFQELYSVFRVFFDEMVTCCVPGCTNYSAKSTNISYHKIPKDPQLRKAWISDLRRENLPPLKNCYVCSEHFDNESFKSDFIEQLIREKKRKRLKADAIPSIFTFTSPTTVSSKRRATIENRIE